MTFFFPLKKLAELENKDVGVYAKEFSKLEGIIKTPFSLVLNYRVFNDFIVFNDLQDLVSESPKTDSERVDLFSRVVDAFKDAKFPQNILIDLKECFELVSLDTSNLSSLTDLAKEQSIISITRSVSYEDYDLVCPKTLFTKNNFFSFLDFIKSSFASLFCPSSIKFRQEQSIDSFTVGLVISRLPPFRFSFNSIFDKDKILIESYVGFIDLYDKVVKNKFVVNEDFLKIEEREIRRQETVSVFNLEDNKSFIKTYIPSGNTSQSVPDNTILEIARLTKRISSLIGKDSFKVLAVSDKNAQPNILSFDFTSDKKPEIKSKKIVEDQEETVLPINLKDPFESENFKQLIVYLKEFLRDHNNGSLRSKVELVLRSLENEVSKDSLKACFDVVLEILSR